MGRHEPLLSRGHCIERSLQCVDHVVQLSGEGHAHSGLPAPFVSALPRPLSQSCLLSPFLPLSGLVFGGHSLDRLRRRGPDVGCRKQSTDKQTNKQKRVVGRSVSSAGAAGNEKARGSCAQQEERRKERGQWVPTRLHCCVEHTGGRPRERSVAVK